MSSRTVSVVLTAQVQNYLSNMRAAEERTREVERGARTATEQFRLHNEALTKVGIGFLAVGTTAAAGVALVVKAASDFGAKMAQLQSLSHASAGQMRQLADAAMTVGTAYGFSAGQVADAEIELTKAGIGVKAQLGGALQGALTLAAAGQLDVAQATEITTVAMTQFGLSAGQVPHVADLLAAGADKALGSVGDLGEALKNGGLQAHNMGLTIDDTVGLLSAFANAGILGAEAGTQMRSMFIQLQRPTAAARGELQQYGISLTDSQGKFVGVTALAGELHDKLGGLTQAQRNAALATIFGSHAITGATVLYQDGAKGIAGWIKGVNDTGFASAQAAGKLNSLQGDVQKLSAAFQTDLIKAGSGASNGLRGITQTATAALQAVGSLPQPVAGAAIEAAALTAAVGLLGGGFLLAIPKIAAFRTQLSELGVTGRGVAGVFGKGAVLSLGIGALAAGLSNIGATGAATGQQVGQAGVLIERGWKGVDKIFGNAGDLTGSMSGVRASLDSITSSNFFRNQAWSANLIDGATGFATFGLAGTHFADSIKANEGQFDAFGKQLAGLSRQDFSASTRSFNELLKAAGGGADTARELLQVMPDYKQALVDAAAKAHVMASDQALVNIAQGKGRDAAKVLAQAQHDAASAAVQQQASLNRLAGSAVSAKVDIGKLQQAIEGFGSATLDARGATRAFYQAIDDADAAVKKNGRTLDVHTQKGRDNQAALDAIATSADQVASKVLKETGSQEKAAAAMQKGREQFVRVAEAMGLAAPAANKLADKLGLIPSNVRTAVTVTGIGNALTQVGDVTSKLKGLDGRSATVTVHYRSDGSVSQTIGSGPTRRTLFAAGGDVTGPGPKGVDSVPALLAPGEHVLTTSDVDRLGGQGGAYRFRAALAAGDVQAYAAGGAALRSAEERVTDARAAVDKARTKAAKRSARDRLAKAERHLADTRHDASAQARQDETARLRTLAQDREDFVSAERRTPGRRSTDPLAYVDQLRSMSRDDNFSSRRQRTFDRAANRYESALVKLAASSEKATAKLDGLRQASAQLHDSIASAVSGGYRASDVPLTGARDASTREVASGWVTRNGMRFRSYSTVSTAAAAGTITAGGLAGYYTQGAAAAKRFADDLARLTRLGYPDALVAEVAGYGVAQGQPIITALLSASASQRRQISAGYQSIGSAAGRAGTIVADDSYGKQIAAAKANADAITKQIRTDGEKLRKLIASAFGLKGYATGTASAAAGIRWVGEDGPELVGFRGGEAVLNRADSARWVRGSGAAGSGGGEITIVLSQPDALAITDADGVLRGTMRVEARGVAHEVVTQRTDQIAVRVLGATA